MHLQQLGVHCRTLAGFGTVGGEDPQHAHVAAHHQLVCKETTRAQAMSSKTSCIVLLLYCFILSGCEIFLIALCRVALRCFVMCCVCPLLYLDIIYLLIGDDAAAK